MEILTFFGGGVIGTFIGYFIKHFLDIRSARRLDEMNRKRKVYEDMIDSMNVFISGRDATKEKKEKLLLSYSQLWLWAPDDVVKYASKLLEYQKQVGVDKNSICEDTLKDSYVNTVISMRKDVGYAKTEVEVKNYQFVSF